MDCKKIGSLIYELRKDKNMTQKQIADLMNISDKTISKWERGLGCPDISLLPELSQILGVSIDQILLGQINLNDLVGGNMNKLKFYVCPQCRNLITTTGNATISCCGKTLDSLVAKKAEEGHKLDIEPVEDELYVTTDHDMKKEHYISFVAYVKGDRALIMKQYPEWNMQFRFRKSGHGKIYFYCTTHGLFYQIV
ncbi:helix-turn-helix domain-containing protein [Romboutsia ilealis]|uniref:helix-turn-helix domain-containing protein n=1 Tax=Romboutsia ilealis TaxID=1115758 RepID=UPI0025B74197|nr:helix-turn-helix domain-containing protein [Romboutsia ilealis]